MKITKLSKLIEQSNKHNTHVLNDNGESLIFIADVDVDGYFFQTFQVFDMNGMRVKYWNDVELTQLYLVIKD